MKPVLFNTKMVQANLNNIKTQTRRVIKYGLYQYCDMTENCIEVAKNYCDMDSHNSPELKEEMIKRHSKYQIGDILYVRETFVVEGSLLNEDGTITHHEKPIIHYKADNENLSWIDEWENEINVPWKPSIHMPKKYARLFLKVTNVRVERLQDIKYDDCLREGFCEEQLAKTDSFPTELKDLKIKNNIPVMEEWWINLWNSTAKDGYKWEDNPYVFVYEYEKTELL